MSLFSRQRPDLSEIRNQIQVMEGRVGNLLGTLDRLEADIQASLRRLTERVDDGERSVRLMAEELDERIDRGNKIWRRIRSREVAEAERRELEGESESDGQVSFFDGEGGEPEGVPSMFGDLAPPGARLQPHQVVAREIARRIAGKA